MVVQTALRVLLVSVLWVGACAGPAQVGVASEARDGAWVDLSSGLRVDRVSRTVAVRAWVCLDRGWLEQVLCLPGTREHESLLVTDVVPSTLHAALLVVGLKPGRPGRWIEDEGAVVLTPPLGDQVAIRVSYLDPDSQSPIELDITEWISDVNTGEVHPRVPWIFGGSLTYEVIEGGSAYAADHSGSIIGMVTFGDELLGAVEVIPDAEAIHAPEWVVRTASVPPVGTEVQVLLSPATQ